MSLAPGQLLQERYEIVRGLKSGVGGSSYEAIDRKLADSACAVKEVVTGASSLESEMRALAALEHPQIPRIRDYFELAGQRYIVLDLVRGQALDEELEQHLRVTGAPVDAEVAAVDMVDVLGTLHYLHSLTPPIVHRALKPAHLIRDERSHKIMLVDFEIARPAEEASGFCAPEHSSGLAGARSDLYSVGATLYNLVSGQAPPALSPGELKADLPEHPGLAAIIARATRSRPEERYASAQEMAAALRAWLQGGPPAEPVVTPIHPLARPKRPANTTTTWGVVAGVALTLALALGFWSASRSAPKTSEVTPSPTRSSSPLPSSEKL